MVEDGADRTGLGGSDATPSPGFIAAIADRARHRWWPADMCEGYLDRSAGIADVRDQALAGTPLVQATHGDLVAYMLRRFGAPTHGCDDRKQIGNWCLTTPDPLVVVDVSPSLSGARFSFRPYVDVERMPEGREKGEGPDPMAARAREACRATLLDLLRPVMVDDIGINALGRVRHPSPLLGHAVDPSRSAGWGIPPGIVEGGGWVALHSVMLSMGRGDVTSGRNALVAAGRRMALAGMDWMPRASLVLAAARLDRAGKRAEAVLLPLDADARDEAANLADIMDGKLPHEWPAFDEATRRDAGDVMALAGADDLFDMHHDHGVRERRLQATCDALLAAAGEDGIPEECLGVPDTVGPEAVQAVKRMPAALRAGGHATLADHVEAALATRVGLFDVTEVLARLSAMARDEEPAEDGATPAP